MIGQNVIDFSFLLQYIYILLPDIVNNSHSQKQELMKNKLLCFLIIICWCAFCGAQQTTSTAGGEVTGAGGTVSYTVGQVSYTNNTESKGTVSQGVQQPYEIFVISSIEDRNGINLELSVYPNPAGTYLKLVSVNCTTRNLTYRLYDANGKLLENKKLDDVETIIQIGKFAPSIYFLKVADNNKEVKTFKIIKI
jgi:hypothetical protein